MKRKDVFQGIISTMQNEIPFPVIQRDKELPVDIGHIITVPGVRRCGKSSLMKIVVNRLVSSGVARERILWVGFDDERLDGMTSDSFDEVLQAYREMYPDIPLREVYMFFDEIQLVDKWELFVLRVYKTYCKNIYVSGSNSQMLSSELSTALRGWPVEYETFPLSFSEYCRFKGVEASKFSEEGRAKLVSLFKEYLHASSFPEVVLMAERSLQLRKVQSYFNTMLFRDLVEHYSLNNPEVVRYFVKRLMSGLTKPSSVNAIYNDLKSQGRKVGKDTLYELADHVCDVFMFFKVYRYSPSIIKEASGLPKYYFIDNGMRNAVLLPQSGDDGKLLENTVYMHLRRNIDTMEQKITYFADEHECDFVLQKDSYIEKLIQVCWSLSDETTRQREIAGIVEASKATGCKDCSIITLDESDEIVHDGLSIKVVPAWRWVLEIMIN